MVYIHDSPFVNGHYRLIQLIFFFSPSFYFILIVILKRKSLQYAINISIFFSISKQLEYATAKNNNKVDKHFRKWYFISAKYLK